MAGGELATLHAASLAPAMLGAIAGECGLAPAADAAGLQWYFALRLEPVTVALVTYRSAARRERAAAHAARRDAAGRLERGLMERLMVLQLEAGGCPVEVQLNGMPVAALGPLGGRACLAVHEYTLAGKNQLSLVVFPLPPSAPTVSQPRVAVGPTWARARLVLLRKGQAASDAGARVLATVEWAVEEGKSYEAPNTQAVDVDLPVAFPRWRWLDAPVVNLTPPVQRQILEFVQSQALELSRGNPDPMLAVAKLRFDELALAYQHDLRRRHAALPRSPAAAVC